MEAEVGGLSGWSSYIAQMAGVVVAGVVGYATASLGKHADNRRQNRGIEATADASITNRVIEAQENYIKTLLGERTTLADDLNKARQEITRLWGELSTTQVDMGKLRTDMAIQGDLHAVDLAKCREENDALSARIAKLESRLPRGAQESDFECG